MRLGGMLFVGYLVLALLMVGVYRYGLPARYAATKGLAANHRVVKGDFAPDPKLNGGARYLGAAVKAGEQITDKALITSPIAWPTKNHILVAFDPAILPKGTDAGDVLSLCGAKGGEIAAVTVTAIDCGSSATATCRVSVEAAQDAAGKLFSPDVAKGTMAFAANGSCKAAAAPVKKLKGKHPRRKRGSYRHGRHRQHSATARQ